LYWGEFKDIRIPLPSPEEVEVISNLVDRGAVKIAAMIAEQRRLIELLQEKRQAVVSLAVTKGLNPDVPMKWSGVELLGDVPAHWTVKPLMRLTPDDRQIMYGIVLPGPHVDDGVPIVKGGDVRLSRLDVSTLNRTTAEIESNFVRSRLRGGDIVYAIRGSIGEAEIVPEELAGANITQDAARIAPLPDVDESWLLCALRAREVFAQLEQRATGATIRGINIFDLKRVRIPTPPDTEQREIARFVGEKIREIEALVVEAGRAISLLQERRTALIAAAVTGKIDVRHLVGLEAA
jgi:type I restriction enzyme S subunit